MEMVYRRLKLIEIPVKDWNTVGSKISYEILLGISFHFQKVVFCEWILNFYTEISMSLCNFLSPLPQHHELTYFQIPDHMWRASVHDSLGITEETLSEIFASLN